MKILILGSTGLLGAALMSHFESSKSHHVLGVSRSNYNRANCVSLDLTNHIDLDNCVLNYKPDVIINAAALTNLNLCELLPEEARMIHVYLVSALNKYDSHIVHISTDSVFDGAKESYSERDSPNPLNVYSKTKHLGEIELRKEDASIIRTNIFGYTQYKSGNSLFNWVVKNRFEKILPGYDNIYFNPISVYSLSKIIEDHIIRSPVGLIHIGTDKKISKYDFLQLTLKHMHSETKVSKFTYCCHDLNRPFNTFLETGFLKDKFGINLKIEDEISHACQMLNKYV